MESLPSQEPTWVESLSRGPLPHGEPGGAQAAVILQSALLGPTLRTAEPLIGSALRA